MEEYLKLDNQVCFPVYLLSREIIAEYRPYLDEVNLTYPQYLVMLVLWDDSPLNINQLGHKLKLDSGTLTPLLKRMEQKGFIKRVRSLSDERKVMIHLTEKGLQCKEDVTCIPEKLLASFKISLDELLHLKNIVTKILDQREVIKSTQE